MNTKLNIEEVAQEIQDLYFERGAVVNKESWDKTLESLKSAYEQGRVEERERCKQIIIRRTEIPTGAKNPTRDAVVFLGEELVELLDETQPKQE